MSNTIAYYHSKDLDGICSGAIIQTTHPEATMIGYDYNEPFDIESNRDKDIIMADVSLPMPQMLELAKIAKSFTWIDHHASAIKEFATLEPQFRAIPSFKAIIQEGIAACEICDAYYFNRGPFKNEAVRLLGMYDTWRNKNEEYSWEELVLPFQFGMRGRCNSLETFPFDLLIDTGLSHKAIIKNIILEGKAVLKYQEQQNEIRCQAAFETELFGLRAIFLNTPGANSLTFKSVYNPDKHDIMVPFCYEGNYWKFSLYTDKDINVGELAKAMGGGGHKQAAGFKIRHLNDILPSIISPLFSVFHDEILDT